MGTSSVTGQTSVFFGDDECDIVWYDTTDTKISCYSPPYGACAAAAGDSYRVPTLDHMLGCCHTTERFRSSPVPRRAVGGRDASVVIKVAELRLDSYSLYATCATSTCLFSYRGASTPQVQYWTGAGAKGKTFRAMGNLLEQDVESYNIVVGGATCAIDTDAWANVNFPQTTQGGSAILWPGGTSGEVFCTIGDGTAGLYNTSFIAKDAALGLGNALPLSSAWQVGCAAGKDPPSHAAFSPPCAPACPCASCRSTSPPAPSSSTRRTRRSRA